MQENSTPIQNTVSNMIRRNFDLFGNINRGANMQKSTVEIKALEYLNMKNVWGVLG
jgi:hypothetical protein